MTTDSVKELVKRLREKDDFELAAAADEAADALEAMAGEVESLKQAVEAERDEQARIEFRLNEVTAERERLKAALVRLGTHINISAGERLMIVQEALGGDAS